MMCYIPCGFPARLIPYFVNRMREKIEGRLRYAVAGDPQDVVSLHGAVGHDRAKFDGFVADTPLARQRPNC